MINPDSQRSLMLDWDRTGDWVLHRMFHDFTSLTIRLSSDAPTVAELIALRKCVPSFRHMPPAELKAAIGNSELKLGRRPTREALGLIDQLQAEGLQVRAENASFVSYLPYDRISKCALLIEDEEEALAVAQSMLAAGVPVESIES